jgi:hypothetical protein
MRTTFSEILPIGLPKLDALAPQLLSLGDDHAQPPPIDRPLRPARRNPA